AIFNRKKKNKIEKREFQSELHSSDLTKDILNSIKNPPQRRVCNLFSKSGIQVVFPADRIGKY
ncbi:MAG TPA: hypothetical protein PLZ10_11640, partial [Chitinophagaceae bacterium]|nr:hypothetical protein [Chitinophagaceae bacterium]